MDPLCSRSADVTITVAYPVDREAGNTERKAAILRALRLSDMSDRLELRPGLSGEDVDLGRIETMHEAAMRHEGEAEARVEAKLDRQRERHFDRRGHF